MSLPNRNDPCPCGSGLKYKKCCLGRQRAEQTASMQGELLLRQALQYLQAGRLAEAEAAYRQLLQAQPRHAEAMHRLGVLYYGVGRHQQAAALLEGAIQSGGATAARFIDLGVVHGALHHQDEAIACFERALELQPDAAEAHLNLGRMHFMRHRLDDALCCYRRALALRPDFPAALLNLGLACQQAGQPEEAIACYRRVLALKPDLAEAHYNLGCVLGEQGRPDEAMASYGKALALRPDFADAHLNLAVLYQNRGEHEQAEPHYREAQRLRPDLAVVHSTALMSLQYRDIEPSAVLEAHRAYAARFEVPQVPRWPAHGNRRDPGRRLKIAYVSPDLRRHSVACFIEPVLAAHDHAQVEVHCYYTAARHDDVTERLKSLSGHWLSCAGWTDEALAGRIAADGIDVLIDLAGHTRDNRLAVFARRPAPVQLSWLGYPGTTGLTAIDYRLCTVDTDPPGAEAWHSERLYRLPRSLWCYRPRTGDEAPAGAHEDDGRDEGIRFGSMNNLAKLSPRTIAIWARILRAVPDARLVMTGIPSGEARRGVEARFAAHAIEPQRLVLHDRIPDAEYRRVLDGLDLALDPFPYNGTTTSCELLSRGVPLVSLAGDRSVSRSGYALLRQLELEWLAAPDPDAYVELAISLARDRDRLRALRADIARRFTASSLRDEAGFTRELERAYRDLWQAWCDAQP